MNIFANCIYYLAVCLLCLFTESDVHLTIIAYLCLNWGKLLTSLFSVAYTLCVTLFNCDAINFIHLSCGRSHGSSFPTSGDVINDLQ